MWDIRFEERFKKEKEGISETAGNTRVEKQHSKGKMTARERISYFFDEGSFTEVGAMRKTNDPVMAEKRLAGDGVVTGFGTVNGRTVYAASQDFTINGGTVGPVHASKICRIMDMALQARCPFVSINDSGGARIEEGINSLAGYSGIFYRNTAASGVIPQISVIMGPCAGGACYSPAISDFIFMVRGTSQMFITGPDVVKAVTGQNATAEDIGGADTHSYRSGVAHFVYDDDRSCLDGVKELLEYLPQNNHSKPKREEGVSVDRCGELTEIVPDAMNRPYDVKDVVYTFADEGTFFEIQNDYAPNVVVGFIRLDGDVVGIVANQPKCSAGVLDVNASDKAARFVRFCDCFGIPLLALTDVPGYLPGTEQEHNGIIRHGAKLLFAFAEATVPKVTLIMRKAYGGAYIAMNSKNIGADMVYAWPIAQIAVMGAEGAVNIIHRRRLREAEDGSALRKQLTEEYSQTYLNPYLAAENGYVDEVIEASETKAKLKTAFSALKNKLAERPEKKHGNIPL